MMDWTDRHCRFFHRQLSRNTLLYTEMIAAAALVRGQAEHLLDHSCTEHPVALQLGGSDPDELHHATRMGATAGFREINLNVGCPSDRVQSGCFGAVLMRQPDLVAECVTAMREATGAEITVKCRIGVDDQDPRHALPRMLRAVRDAGCRRVIIHARKAWLQGLSPKQNREVPPLDYDLVLSMKQAFPDMRIILNGGVQSLENVQALLSEGMDGVMIGRAAYHRPWDVLGRADSLWGQPPPVRTRQQVVQAMLPYVEAHLGAGGRLHDVTRHMLGLFSGRPGARVWRRVLSEDGSRTGAGPAVLERALAATEPAATEILRA